MAIREGIAYAGADNAVTSPADRSLRPTSASPTGDTTYWTGQTT